MARTKSAAPSAKAKPKAAKTELPAPSPHPLARRRALAAAVLAVVALLTLGGKALWEFVGPTVAGRERYMLRAENIAISDLPEWIIGDVRGQVIHSGGLDGRLSVVDPKFVTILENAFGLHPWVAKVQRIEKRFPPGVFVELEYRRPVAAVESPLGDGSQLLPIDAGGVLLPADDVPLIRRSYLPRISGVVSPPATGQRWDDPRVAGALDLAVRLADEWESLSLVEISPSARPEVLGDRRFFVYDLVTRGRTRIVWGAPPRDGVPGEDEFAVKLDRLKQCVSQYATLDWTDWPAIVDVRRGIAVTPRTAKKPPDAAADPVVAEKIDEPDDEPVVK